MEVPDGSRFEYLLAEFGVKVPSRELTLSFSPLSSKCLVFDERMMSRVISALGMTDAEKPTQLLLLFQKLTCAYRTIPRSRSSIR